jgi:hypothetical protein
LKKSHEKKFRNWLEVKYGVEMDRFEEIKLALEKEVIPGFVHSVEEAVKNTSSEIMHEIR